MHSQAIVNILVLTIATHNKKYIQIFILIFYIKIIINIILIKILNIYIVCMRSM